jgi:prevent-host-death family protein
MTNMTRTVSAADAKSHFSDHLRASERGESIVITRHGKPVAALVPASDLPELERLRAAGPAAGLAGLAGGWPGSGTLVKHVQAAHRSRSRRPPELR